MEGCRRIAPIERFVVLHDNPGFSWPQWDSGAKEKAGCTAVLAISWEGEARDTHRGKVVAYNNSRGVSKAWKEKTEGESGDSKQWQIFE